jgi:hypothetical protein
MLQNADAFWSIEFDFARPLADPEGRRSNLVDWAAAGGLADPLTVDGGTGAAAATAG